MNILHYSLGFPPFRRGGMTQYCLDLMMEQVKAGHSVALLWPGKLQNLSEKSNIKKKPDYTFQDALYCENYELVNPLPVPLMDGLRNPEMYLIKKNGEVYRNFFRDNKFEVLHIHTFMGLPAEVVEAARDAGVKTIFTSHDYFPLCPRCNFFHAGKDCTEDYNCKDCVSCNQYGLSLEKMKFFQSNLYKNIKENAFVKTLRAKHNRKMYDATDRITEEKIVDSVRQMNYQKLRHRNIEILEMFDVVHFNSTNTLHVYQKRGYSGRNAQIISISNGAIENHKKIRKTNGRVRFGYLGPLTTHKGYNLFWNGCDALWKSGQHNFEAHIFVEIDNPPPYMTCHKPYKYSELPNVMDKFDVLVTPSECEETFGFTVLEALSYGVPAIVTNRVGAADLIKNGKNGFIISAKSFELENALLDILKNPNCVQKMNQYIVSEVEIKTMQKHCAEICVLYKM